MKYDHMVKHNGVYYTAGQEVPEEKNTAAVDKSSLPFSDSDIEFETNPAPGKQYTRTEINRMNKQELQELALKNGVEDANEMTGSELKEYLLNTFGL